MSKKRKTSKRTNKGVHPGMSDKPKHRDRRPKLSSHPDFEQATRVGSPGVYWGRHGEFYESGGIPLGTELDNLDLPWSRDALIYAGAITPAKFPAARWQCIQALNRNGGRLLWNVQESVSQNEGYCVPVAKHMHLSEWKRDYLPIVLLTFMVRWSRLIVEPGTLIYVCHDRETNLCTFRIYLAFETQADANTYLADTKQTDLTWEKAKGKAWVAL